MKQCFLQIPALPSFCASPAVLGVATSWGLEGAVC